jgi:hypothetical protein
MKYPGLNTVKATRKLIHVLCELHNQFGSNDVLKCLCESSGRMNKHKRWGKNKTSSNDWLTRAPAWVSLIRSWTGSQVSCRHNLNQTNILAGDKSALLQEIEYSPYHLGTGSAIVILYPLQPDNQKVSYLFEHSQSSYPIIPYGTSNSNMKMSVEQ